MNWDAFLVLYAVITVLGVMAAWQVLHTMRDRRLAWALVTLLGVLALEQVYYGCGRYWQGLYTDLSWFWPGVMTFKTAYCLALAVIVRQLLTHKERI
tara:strand:+ start:142 stop:432 length:291 start_codon:yes stop_codon:yes gene_type:complete